MRLTIFFGDFAGKVKNTDAKSAPEKIVNDMLSLPSRAAELESPNQRKHPARDAELFGDRF